MMVGVLVCMIWPAVAATAGGRLGERIPVVGRHLAALGAWWDLKWTYAGEAADIRAVLSGDPRFTPKAEASFALAYATNAVRVALAAGRAAVLH